MVIENVDSSNRKHFCSNIYFSWTIQKKKNHNWEFDGFIEDLNNMEWLLGFVGGKSISIFTFVSQSYSFSILMEYSVKVLKLRWHFNLSGVVWQTQNDDGYKVSKTKIWYIMSLVFSYDVSNLYSILLWFEAGFFQQQKKIEEAAHIFDIKCWWQQKIWWHCACACECVATWMRIDVFSVFIFL